MKCPTCGKVGKIVNECRCDPNNLPTDPRPKYPFDKGELWTVATATLNNPDTTDETKSLCLWIRRICELESRVEELTEQFYEMKEKRGQLLYAAKRVVQWFEAGCDPSSTSMDLLRQATGQ